MNAVLESPTIETRGEPFSSFNRLRIAIYLVVLASCCFQGAIIPLLPEYSRRFGLSGFGEGMLLAATALSSLLVSLPAGRLADRFGARRLTIAASWIMAASMVVEAVAPSFGILMLSRLIFGAGYGIVWTAGLAWLAGASPDGSGLGGSVVSSGIGGVIGPVLAGGLAEWIGLGSPFVVGAGVFVALSLLLTTVRLEVAPVAPSDTAGVRSSINAMVRNRSILASTTAVILAGLTWSVAYLLAPVQLHAGGVSPDSIGLILSAAAIVYVIGSTATAAFGTRAVRVKVIFAGMLALTVTLLPAIASSEVVAIAAMLCGSAIARSVLWTVAYPLAARGAEEAGLGVGVVMGFLQAVWAVTSVLSPLAAGVVSGSLPSHAVYAMALMTSLAVFGAAGFWIFRRAVTQARNVLDRAGATF